MLGVLALPVVAGLIGTTTTLGPGGAAPAAHCAGPVATPQPSQAALAHGGTAINGNGFGPVAPTTIPAECAKAHAGRRR